MKSKKQLARAPYINLPLWDFYLHSLFKEYGGAFLFRVAAPHPIKTLKGIKMYSQSNGRNSSIASMVSTKTIKPQWKGGKGSVVGIGFCVKPMEPSCISGRANHDCAYFENHLHLSQDPKHEPCQDCLVREIGMMALTSKSDFYIMTSAKDILYDLFLPSLNSNTYGRALLCLCQYSFEPFKIALFISGINALLFPFEKGDCTDYRTWRQADKGIKDTQTKLWDIDHERIKALLQSSRQQMTHAVKYTKPGNIFHFDA
jgi:hypothetical protein